MFLEVGDRVYGISYTSHILVVNVIKGLSGDEGRWWLFKKVRMVKLV